MSANSGREVIVLCPTCGASVEHEDWAEGAGRTVLCPNCSDAVRLPSLEQVFDGMTDGALAKLEEEGEELRKAIRIAKGRGRL